MSEEIPIPINMQGPCCVELEAGKRYFWCACGKSAREPFCDGSHKGTGIIPLSFVADENQSVKLCGCQKTQNPPYCDGSHNKNC